MKKRIVVLLFAACLLLAACQAEDPENLFETTLEETGSTTAPAGALPATMTGEYQYGNMQKNAPSGEFMLYDGNILFSIISNSRSLLCTYDPVSGEVGLLCQDAACTHSGVGEEEDCPSANVFGNLESYNGKFYKLDASLQIMELTDGTFRQIVDGGKRRMLVVADKFPLRYFADTYGLTYRAAFSGCSTDTEPSARTIAYLIDQVRAEGIPAVYYLELSSHRTAEIIGEETGAKPLLFHSCHNVTRREFDQGVTYLQLMNQNAANLEIGLN